MLVPTSNLCNGMLALVPGISVALNSAADEGDSVKRHTGPAIFGVVAALGAMSPLDMAQAAPPKKTAQTAPAPTQTPSWAGFYLGGNIGSDFAAAALSANGPPLGLPGQSLGSAHTQGLLGGLQAGYNWQNGPWVLGVEAAESLTHLSATFPIATIPTLQGSVTEHSIGTATVHLGYAVGQVLLYVGGGVAWTHAKYNVAGPVPAGFGFCCTTTADPAWSGSNTPFGGTFQTGADYKLDQHWSVKLQYDYTGFGSQNADLSSPAAGNPSIKANLNIQDILGGVNFHY